MIKSDWLAEISTLIWLVGKRMQVLTQADANNFEITLIQLQETSLIPKITKIQNE
jgi:hypothetical protein